MAGNKGPRKPQRCGLAGSSFLDDHAFRMRLAGTFVATAAYDFIRRRPNARPSITNTSQPEHHQMEFSKIGSTSLAALAFARAARVARSARR